MRYKGLLTALLSTLLCTPLAYSATTLSDKIAQQIKTTNPNMHVGIIIKSLKDNRIIYSTNDRQLFIPASTDKLLTAVAAIAYLGPHFHFQTDLLTTGHQKSQTLDGNLYIRFTGDPTLTRQQLNDLLAQLSKKGIRQIKGHVYIDNTQFRNVPYGPGWFWDDLSYSYAAPLSPVIINHNNFSLRMTPNELGDRPSLHASFPENVVSFKNYARTTKSYRKDCPILIYSERDNTYRVYGCIPKNGGIQRRALAIRNPTELAKHLIQQSLNEQGIRYTHPIDVKDTPQSAVLLAQHTSANLPILVKKALKKSDNLTTNALFLTLGATYYQKQGTWANSLHALKRILAPTGIDFKQANITDGAGMSRYNLISPGQMMQLLRYAYLKKDIRTTLWSTLPISGYDGTLKWRLRDKNTKKRIHAKTGSMTGVSSLAGYVQSKTYGPIAFVIFINGFVGREKPYIIFQDKLCASLI